MLNNFKHIQMATKNSFILKAMNVIFWVIFIGLCIKTGAILTSFLISLFIESEAAKDLYLGLNFFGLYTFDKLQYVLLVSIIVILTGLKAYIAFLVVKIFLKFNFSNPFNKRVILIISKISYIALVTGILAILATAYSDWLIKKGIAIPQEWQADEILFFAGVIYIIAQVFKRGIDIQAENELTV